MCLEDEFQPGGQQGTVWALVITENYNGHGCIYRTGGMGPVAQFGSQGRGCGGYMQDGAGHGGRRGSTGRCRGGCGRDRQG